MLRPSDGATVALTPGAVAALVGCAQADAPTSTEMVDDAAFARAGFGTATFRDDGFTGVNSIKLPVRTGESTTAYTAAYDAGTEINTEDFSDLVPPCTPFSASAGFVMPVPICRDAALRPL